MHVLPELDAQRAWQIPSLHEVVKIVDALLESNCVGVKVGQNCYDRGNDVSPSEPSNHHANNGYAIFKLVLRRDISVTDASQGHHGPIQRNKVHAASVVLRARDARIAFLGHESGHPSFLISPVRDHASRNPSLGHDPYASHPMAQDHCNQHELRRIGQVEWEARSYLQHIHQLVQAHEPHRAKKPEHPHQQKAVAGASAHDEAEPGRHDRDGVNPETPTFASITEGPPAVPTRDLEGGRLPFVILEECFLARDRDKEMQNDVHGEHDSE
mmetsp:Transcript_41997/g.115921  ORF Transcript_41997/g.115921 Transcript_41997/m.115921 type:complete len:270 (+) Transcript_41997:1091-1900(+)